MESTITTTEPLTIDTDHQLVTGLSCLRGRFKEAQVIGYGATGLVYAATDCRTDTRVAIKKLVFSSQRSCQLALREIRLLRQMKHDNIVTVHEILDPAGATLESESDCSDQEHLDSAYIVQELLDTDLHRLIQSRQLTVGHSKLVLYQLLRGLKYIHSANVIHRDLKPGNVMVNCETLLVKIGDFGLARVVDPSYNHQGHLTENVGSCWYKAPEVMLSPGTYTQSVDMWAVGCIFAEMLLGQPLFPGANELDQLLKVIDTLHLTDADWSLVLRVMPNKLLKNHPLRPRTPLSNRLSNIDTQSLDLLEQLLSFHAAQRPTVDEALANPYMAEYHSAQDEPIALTPFTIEHEVDALPPSVLRQMILRESCRQPHSCGTHYPHSPHIPADDTQEEATESCPSTALSGQSSPRLEEEMHTLEEILQFPSSQHQDQRERESQELVTEEDGDRFSCEIVIDVDPVAVKNLRNASSSRQNSPNIFEVKDSSSRPMPERLKVKSRENSQDDEKEVAEVSEEKLQEDIEIGNVKEGPMENDDLGKKECDPPKEYPEMPLTVQIDTDIEETENLKETCQPTAKQVIEGRDKSSSDMEVQGSESPGDVGNKTPTESSGDSNRGRGHPGRPRSRRGSGNDRDAKKKEGDVYVKNKQKSDRQAASSRKLIMDKIESEKNWRQRQRNRHRDLTDEELDELYRLPTDHLRNDNSNDNDYSNQRLREKLKASLRQCGKANEEINERIREEYPHYEGACGGDDCPEEVYPTARQYQLSPTFSDEDSQIVQLEISSSSTNAVILCRNEFTAHNFRPRSRGQTANQDSALATNRQRFSGGACSTIPVQSTGGSSTQRDPSSSPEAPSSPRTRQTGARPKKSPKKQKAL